MPRGHHLRRQLVVRIAGEVPAPKLQPGSLSAPIHDPQCNLGMPYRLTYRLVGSMTTTGERVPTSVRIGNCSGFYGDRHSAMREMLTGGDLDYLTGDYLAELTMLILARDRAKSPDRGYAKTFLTQLEECLGTALDKGVRIVANAGGLNPSGLADAVRALAERLGLDAEVAHVEGDDLVARAGELDFGAAAAATSDKGNPLAANAYLGAWGIVDCLNSGADIVVTGRVTDASVIVGPAAAHFGWGRDDY